MGSPVESRCCAGCYFFVRHEEPEIVGVGDCRRYAPRPVLSDSAEPMAEWPTVYETDWCGEFRLRSEDA